MEDITLEFSGRIYHLTNDSGIYQRAIKVTGDDGAPFEILAYYDKFNGRILDENYSLIEKGRFWSIYRDRKKLMELAKDNDRWLEKAETQLLPLVNNNVTQKRNFLGTLMTISAAVIAGLFFLFSTDYSGSYYLWLAVTSGILYSIFIFAAAIWLVLVMSQESVNLDRQLKFYRRTREDSFEKLGTSILNESSFREFLNQKLDASKKLDKDIIGTGEHWFIIVCAFFILGSMSIFVLFVILIINSLKL